MALRTVEDRLLQTALFEGFGLVLVVPVYATIFGRSGTESFVFVAVLTMAVLIWSPIHNTLFDVADWHRNRRTACKRPSGLRAVHAVSHEITAIAVTFPLIAYVGGHGPWDVLKINVGLTLFYTAYAFVFHRLYDGLRPVPVPRR